MANKNRSSPSPTTPKLMETNGFSLMNEDLLRNILSRLPATSFASAATVSKTWNAACCHILSRPKFSSAISLKPLPLVALQEVFDKVMSEPIRPHFAIASVGPGFEIKDVLQFMVEKVGSRTPIIVSSVKGILGRDALSHEFREACSSFMIFYFKLQGWAITNEIRGVHRHISLSSTWATTISPQPSLKISGN
ncbi:hypothetical protein GOBAR_AA35431 [Gossypium barbadense]|uniref:F-box domain-containing protein n=1 Tax=Gossypium barbadense TaxID=3634 RepID=A0A2P5W2E8_GOSBA|nr:hypothetical protein GOBAR_AA35431 [Gossypium barbadense]